MHLPLTRFRDSIGSRHAGESPDNREQLVYIERLGQPSIGAHASCALGEIPKSTDQDNGKVLSGWASLEPAANFGAAQLRHFDIGDDQVRMELAEFGDQLKSVRNGLYG